MKKNKISILSKAVFAIAIAALFTAAPVSAQTEVAASAGTVPSNANDDFISKPVGGTEFDLGQSYEVDALGYPTKNSIATLHAEMDYQGAVSAYLQTIPQMTLFGSKMTNHYYGANGNTDCLIMYNDPSIAGMYTPNTVVAYSFTYPNLKETGPLVFEHPAGATAGIVMDMQMRWLADIGVPHAGGKAAKYLILHESQELPEGVNEEEFTILRCPTTQLFYGWRVLEPANDLGVERELKIYPYAERANPTPNKFVDVPKDADTYYMAHPTGMKYWEQLHAYIQIENVQEADRFMMARLASVGIEKGKPFNPTDAQKAILEKAAFDCEKMAMASAFAPRSEQSVYRDDTNWVNLITLDPTHRTEHTLQLEERVDFAFEAYGISPAMKAEFPGIGSAYLSSYRDVEGQWFDGGKNYTFTIQADVPAARFWDISLYKMETRGMMPVEEGATNALNTFTEGLVTNEDGTISIFMGPGEAPEGFENNFIKTTEGMRWFTYFRLYGPTEAYLDKSWPMNDIIEVK